MGGITQQFIFGPKIADDFSGEWNAGDNECVPMNIAAYTPPVSLKLSDPIGPTCEPGGSRWRKVC
jgi:hypothetical protein